MEILDEEFDAGETTQGLIVYQRDGGLTAADQEKIAADAEAVEALSAGGAAADPAADGPVRARRAGRARLAR